LYFQALLSLVGGFAFVIIITAGKKKLA